MKQTPAKAADRPALLLFGALTMAGCMSATQITAELHHLDALSQAAQKSYLHCLTGSGLSPDVVTTDAKTPGACLPSRHCLALTTVASAAGAAAVSSGKVDPWLRGPAAQNYRKLYPAAVVVCNAGQKGAP